MKNFKLYLLILGSSCLVFLSGCYRSITELFPKAPRPFQEKKFDSEQWKSGDYQTRGEMAKDLRESISGYQKEWKKSADEVRQILGKPDVVTEADYGYTGRHNSVQKVELWLYYVEIEENHYLPRKPGEPERKLLKQAFKLYFPKTDSASFYTVISERNGDHSMVMPVVGTIRF